MTSYDGKRTESMVSCGNEDLRAEYSINNPEIAENSCCNTGRRPKLHICYSLPDEIILFQILPYLEIDYYSVFSLTCAKFRALTNTENVYQVLCERSYLQQISSHRKSSTKDDNVIARCILLMNKIKIKKYNGSFHTMLLQKPRVKTGCGLYVLKKRTVKKIQRDMWTDIPKGTVLETIYYRYLLFKEDGSVMYAVTSSPPHLIAWKFVAAKSKGRLVFEKGGCGPKGDKVIWGKYLVKRGSVMLSVKQPWHEVRMSLRISEEGDEDATGKFWSMMVEKHTSSKSGNFDEVSKSEKSYKERARRSSMHFYLKLFQIKSCT